MREMKPNVEWKIGEDGLHAGDEAQRRVEKQRRRSSCRAMKTFIV
ncbi:hypothetical protein [Metabacillus litoralis]|nr:hypothetical protein [Metabacillus litoralis]